MSSILFIFLWKEDSLNTIIYQRTKYGKVKCYLKDIMQIKHITTYKLALISNVKYGIIRRYGDNNVTRYDANILAKLCFCLDCDLSSILKYEK